MALRKGDGTLYFLLTDHLGSTAITATSGGGFSAELRYYPWGGTRYTSGTTPTSYRYTGQREAEVGLYYYGARFYDPQLGRFISTDTIIPQQQGTQAWDRYAYVNNSPIKYTDPSGHSVDCAIGEENCEAGEYIVDDSNSVGDDQVETLWDDSWNEFHCDYCFGQYVKYYTFSGGTAIPNPTYFLYWRELVGFYRSVVHRTRNW